MMYETMLNNIARITSYEIEDFYRTETQIEFKYLSVIRNMLII